MEEVEIRAGVQLTPEQVAQIYAAIHDQTRRAQELQTENEELYDQLEAAARLRKNLQADLADAEDQGQALKQELDRIQSTNEWLRRELDMAYAKIEMVELIFGANRCGGCH